MNENAFKLDERLEQDSIFIGQFDLCQLRLINKDAWLWFILVPLRANTTEIFQLSTADRYYLMDEINAMSVLMQEVGKFDKLNVGALGNIVKQLHVHVIGRQEDDAGWPGPVWGVSAGSSYSDEAISKIVERLKIEVRKNQSIHLDLSDCKY